MNKLTKVVNIYPSMPITGVNPPIRSVVKRVTKSVDEIRTCLMARAIVEEVLSTGETVRLDIGNYDKFLDTSHKKCCGCGCGSCNCDTVEKHTVVTDEKTPWQIAYDKYLEGKNLALMSRKQRRSVEAAARAAADAAVATSEPEVVMGVATIESTDVTEEVVVDEKVEVEETVEVQEEVVKTDDVEDLTEAVE